MIDTFCLGVKGGDFISFTSASELQRDVLDRLFRDEAPVRMTPFAGRKLIEDAAAYARELGFAPCADFKKACRVLGGITAAECDEEFAFGREGRPFYIQGPYDSEARARSIVQTLERNCGAGQFDYLLATGANEFDAPDDAAETWNEEAPNLASRDSHGVYEMASRFQAEQPGVVVRVNPHGRSKVSDQLELVAQPLLDEVPDYESKRMILHLAALAWNSTVAEGTESVKILKEIVRLMPGAQGEAMFDFLAARVATLFPEEDRIIGKVEIDPVAGNHFNLRVMSLSPQDNPPPALRRQRRARLSAV